MHASDTAWPLVLLAVTACAVLFPGRHYVGPLSRVTVAKMRHDSFPLSTYPMFSADRRGRVTVAHVVGITADGEERIPRYRHFGTGGLNQVRRQVARAIRRGEAREVAQRYADSLAKEPEAEIVRVRVARSTFEFDRYFAGDHTPRRQRVYAECEVGGRAVDGPDAIRVRRPDAEEVAA